MKKNLARVFAENLAAIRKRKGLSQSDLAQKAGISTRMISHYESEGIFPPADRFEALADALEIPAFELLKYPVAQREPTADLTGIDPRSVKKLRDILSLSVEDRNNLYRVLNSMIRKTLLEQQTALPKISAGDREAKLS
jgi:transcriptional regulator with XRE-family HTH domain